MNGLRNYTLLWYGLCLILLGTPLECLLANHVQITDLVYRDAHSLTCTLAWENSWSLEATQPPGNHDAIWLFVKMTHTDGHTVHVPLSSDPDTYELTETALEANPAPDHTGVMIHRAENGRGRIPPTRITLRFLEVLPPGSYRFQVHAIEMVYVPEGPYYLGDGAANHRLGTGDDLLPLWIDSDERIELGAGPGQLANAGAHPPADDIPQSYPRGFGGFYLMKYEISQAQFVAFLNALTYSQQAALTHSAPDALPGTPALAPSPDYRFRNGIVIVHSGLEGIRAARYGCDADNDGHFNEPEDGQNRACNFLHAASLLAYLDWAALRPATELEYEKACRGAEQPAIPWEFAWGTDAVVDANTVLQDGTPRETVREQGDDTRGLASHGYMGPQGPLRCGFGAGASTTRNQSGAGYYGIFELSGNLWEMCVTVDSQGLLFDGSPGDGQISALGRANQTNWPDAESGMCYRGGGWNSGILSEFRDLAVSDRYYVGLPLTQSRNTAGGRGARSVW